MEKMAVLWWPILGMMLALTHHIQDVQTAKVINTFSDPTYSTRFRHLVMHKRTGYIYVGAINRIYELNSKLDIVHNVIKTGPKMDNPNCEPREGDHCFCLARERCNKVLTDSQCQALALDIAGNTLYACHNLFYGSCSRIRLSDFKEEQYEYKPIVSNNPSIVNSSTIMVIGPGLEEDSNNLYIATTKSAIGFSQFTDQVPLIASRDLKTFDFTYIDSQYSTSLFPRHQFKETFKVYYRYGFSYAGFTYYLAVQKSKAGSPDEFVEYHTRIMRVCQKDNRFYSYVEVPLKCQPDSSKEFRIVQAAYIGRPGTQIADALDLQEDEEALFAVFTTSNQYSHQPKAPSAICAYSLKKISQNFKQNQQYCFQGHGKTGPEHITTPVPCHSTNFKDFQCGEHESNHPIEGDYQAVTSIVQHRLSGNMLGTSILSKGIGEHTVVYIGDDAGNLAKLVLYYYKESRTVRGSMFANVAVDAGHYIQKDMLFDKDKNHLYMMSENQVFQVKLADCMMHTTCESCIGAGDPHCGWCPSHARCTEIEECSEEEYVWIRHNEQCPGIQKVSPLVLPFKEPETEPLKVRLWLLTLPDTSMDLRCQIKADSGTHKFDGRAFRNEMDNTITCEGFTGVPPVPDSEVAHNVSLTLVVADKQWVSTSVEVYDCTHYDSCSSCTGGPYPCAWCVVDSMCKQQNQSCPTQGPLLVSPHVDVINSNVVLTSGQIQVREGPDSCPYIEAIKEYIVPSGHKAHIQVMGKNLRLWDGGKTYPALNCRFKTPEHHVYTPASVTEIAGTEDHIIKCDPIQLDYIQDKGLVNFPFDVEWEFGQELENPGEIQVLVYKCSAMVSNCGRCLTLNPMYNCGWCQTVCTLKDDCPNWLDRDSVCPDPLILRFDPDAGPVNGRTIITIHGFNLGRTTADLIGGIRAANQQCRVIEENYVPSSSIQCETGPAGRIMSGPVTVTVVNQYSTESAYHYHYTEPQFENLIPIKGLVTGDNLVTITGSDLHLGNNATVYVNEIECPTEWRNNSQLVFRTPAVSAPMLAPVRVEVDGESFGLGDALNFVYIPDPIIQSVHPVSAIVSGGTLVTVTGTNFDGVQKPALRFTWQQIQVPVECIVVNSTALQCIMPDVIDKIEIPEDLAIRLPYNVELDKLTLSPKEINEMMDYKPVSLYGDPIVLPLDHPDHTVKYEPDASIEIGGENLALFRLFPDWVVFVGGTPCTSYIVSPANNSLIIYPPEKPQYASNGVAEIEVRLGYFTSHPGAVQYPVENDTNIALILGLIFGLVLPIIVAILILVICLRRQVHKNHRTNRHGLITDNRGSYQPAAMLPPPSEMRAEVHEDVEDKNLITESPADPDSDTETVDGPDYVQRLLNKIENKKLRLAVAEVVIPRDRLHIGEVIGHGHFGCVYVATFKAESAAIGTKVAVKTLQGDDFPAHMVTAFLEEGVVMKKFDHPHVLRLLGVGVGDNDEPMVIIPYMSNGDLRSYVRNKEKSFTARQLLQLAQQVAKGMAYLASLNFVHRDLAARNCMIDETNTVKVADFGLSKNLFEKDYYSSTRDRKTKLPVKWMALESLEEFRFTIKSDVWSFGVLMWELMTRGTTPYADVDIFDLRAFLSENRRLPKPKYCPEHVYSIMTDCWNRYPETRPTFADLVNRLELLLNPPKKRQSHSQEPMYVNFNEFDNAEYLNPISAPPPETPAPMSPAPMSPDASLPDLPSEPPPPKPPTPRVNRDSHIPKSAPPPPPTASPTPPLAPPPPPTAPPPPESDPPDV